MSTPFGGALPDEIVLTREEAATILLALDDAVELVDNDELRQRIERSAQTIVEKFLPDLPDL